MTSDKWLLIPNQPPCCPVTGLPITSKPEWTDVRLDIDFTVTFSIIGNAILLTTARGNTSYKGIKCLFKKISEVIHEAGLSGKKYIELKDYTMLMNIPPRAVRMAWSDYMLKEATKGYLQGVWVFGASLFLRLMFQAGQKINKPAIPFGVVKDYPEAIQSALTVLRQKGVTVGDSIHPGLTKNDWSLEIEGYGISFELIGDDILYTIAHGRLKEPDVEKFFQLHNKVLQEAGLIEKGYFYRIINWERFERSTWQVRRMYIEGMKELNKHITCKLTVIFGLNSFMKALAEVSKPFLPAPVMIANDFLEARAIIEQSRERELRAKATGKRRKLKEKTYTKEQVKGFADEMLQVLGELNWEKVGLSVDGISDKHPLKSVFNALAVIKLDLDELLQEKEKSQKSLQESEKRFTSIFNAQQNGIIIIDPETHTIVDANVAALHMLGAMREDAVGRECHQYICPTEKGKCPITDLGMNIDHAERMLIRIDRTKVPILKSVSRMMLGGKEFLIESFIDISDRKKAEEALRWKTALLEAQVNTSIDGILVVDENNKRAITNRRLIDLWGIPQHILDDEDDTALLKYVVSLTRWPDKFVEKVMYLYNHPHETSRDEIEFKNGMILDRYSAPVLGAEGYHYGRIWTFHDITERKQAENALRESEEKYRNILESIEDGYFEVDLSGNFTFFNPSMCTILGYPGEEMPGMNYTKYMDDINAKRVFKIFNKVYKTGAPSKNFEWYIIRKDGTRRYIEVSVSLINDKEGSSIGFRGIARDISERKKAEEALKESEEKYRNILENIEDGYFEVDLAGNFTFFNPSMCRIYGYGPEEMLGMGYKRYTDDITAKEVFQIFNKVYKTGVPSKGFEWNIIRKDGTKRNLEISASLIVDAGGRANGFRGITRDVSERKSIELELEKHRNHLEELIKERTAKLMRTSNFLANIINSSIDGIITTDIEGTILHTSPRIKDILGYEQDELTGKKVHTFFMGGHEEIKDILDEVMQKGEIRGYELRSVKKSGESVVLNLSISLLRDEKGDVIGTTGIYRDVTEEKRMEEDMKQAMLQAEFASRAKSQFLANISHEIRTPLNGIMGMTDLCLETELNREQRQLVDSINREGHSLLQIVNEILDFAKIEAGKIELEQISFDLRNLLEDMAESSSYRTAQKGLTFSSYIAPGVPTQLVGDPGRLRQVLRNLIDNAIKFTHEGGIDIKTDLAEDMGNGIKVRFLVKDTGIGIPKDKQSIIFESFTQADGSTTRKYGGTGLGITISKQMAELMGGTLGVDSEEGEGSTFWFTAVFSRQNKTDSPKQQEVSLSDVKMLVVDDVKSSRHLLAEHLKSWGSFPVEAASAKEALSILKKSTADGERFNLVLSNLNMQEMNGFDFARKIRRLHPKGSIPIIIYTAQGTPGDGKTCRDIGIEGYLTKPIKENDLRRAVEIVLDSSMRGEKAGNIDLVTKHSTAEMDRKEVRILLAEDYPTNQEIAKRYLVRAGYQVDLVEDGKQALETFKRKHYDLILMDIQMPIMDGLEATAAIRKAETDLSTSGNENLNQTVRRIPIIAMTAHATKEHQKLCLDAGMDDFLSKPISKKGLLSTLEKWIQSGIKPSLSSEPSNHLPSKDGQYIGPAEAHTGESMDLDRALEEFEGDRDTLSEVIEGFTRKVGEQIGTIRRALSCGDAETIRREAHSIKGGGANLTAEKLSKIAFELESKGKSKDLDGAGEIINGLENELAALMLYVEENFPKLGEPCNPEYPER